MESQVEGREEHAGRYCCVWCGAEAAALYRRYGPTVLKLAACESCGGTVDKYVEYDPVIVMIDLVLISREAQRHVLYNTQFKTFWKLFMILILLETYGVWCKNNIINLSIDTLCQATDTEIMAHNASFPYTTSPFMNFWGNGCFIWGKEVKIDDSDPFISEKAFYIAFASVSSGIAAFTFTIHGLMKLVGLCWHMKNVTALSLVKTITLGNMSHLFTLPLLIWGIVDLQTKIIHILLVFAYSFLVFLKLLSVMYSFNMGVTSCVLLLGYVIKISTVYTAKCIIDKFV